MLCMDNPTSQSSVAVSPVWLPLIKKELKTARNVRGGKDWY